MAWISPGLDPDRNTVQMDVFPTNLIDNIIVYKTFTPNLPGDFTGGMVEIITKDFPARPTSVISLGLGYNPNAHLKNTFVTYDGGGLDGLAIEDGSRKLPFSKRAVIPDPASIDGQARLEGLTSSMDPTLATKRESQFLNRSLAFSLGNQINGKKATIGYNFAINYTSNSSFDPNTEYGLYRKPKENTKFAMQDDGSRLWCTVDNHFSLEYSGRSFVQV